MCGCRKFIEEKLKPLNARLVSGFLVTETMELAPPLIALEKIDEKKRGKLPNLVASHCPFCGEKYLEIEP